MPSSTLTLGSNDALDGHNTLSCRLEVPPAPFSAQFFDRNKTVSKARAVYIKILAVRTILITVSVFAIFSIYWGALFDVPARSLEGWIVDFDGGLIGQNVSQQVIGLSGSAITWIMQSPFQFPNGPSDLASEVVAEHCWVAIAINRGSSAALNASLVIGATPYDPSTAITGYGVEARNENAYRSLLRPTIETSLQQIAYNFSLQYAKDLAARVDVDFATIPPEILVRPIYYTINNLRPFDVSVATAVTFVGLIYLLILSFFVVNSGILARGSSGLERLLATKSLIYIRIVTPIVIYFILSCMYSLVTLAFQLPFDRNFGKAGFVVFWMLSWFGMTAAGLALESMITLVTINYIQVFLILWIIGNVAVCVWPMDALHKVYSYGYAAPFYQISRGVRTVIFRTKNEVGFNLGILSIWIVISCITLPLVQWYRRREAIITWKKEQITNLKEKTDKPIKSDDM